jgi:catechol 2,3-dioxygenase-like lactoylglutathione lyase family enzyme
MQVGLIHHIAINTEDIDKSIAFYGDILKLKRGPTVQMPEFALTYFELPNGGSLELFDYKGVNSRENRKEEAVGLRHIAFLVKGVADHEKELRKAGVTITLPTTELPELAMRVMLFLDPNGVTVEFCEPLRASH